MRQRLQRILAASGVASRRASEELIRQGRVSVNGVPVTKLGAGADPDMDTITVDGEKIKSEKKIYLMLNKPPGYLCTSSDELGRSTVHDLIPLLSQRLFTVGRLDRDAEGLLILTNDGDFALRAAHPRAKVGKRYRVYFEGRLTAKGKKGLEHGIVLDGKRTLPARVISARRLRGGGEAIVEIREGRKRQIKRMFLAIGCPVKRLKRISIGRLALGALPAGRYRFLTPRELDMIFGNKP